jgi:hypothetical protein
MVQCRPVYGVTRSYCLEFDVQHVPGAFEIRACLCGRRLENERPVSIWLLGFGTYMWEGL